MSATFLAVSVTSAAKGRRPVTENCYRPSKIMTRPPMSSARGPKTCSDGSKTGGAFTPGTTVAPTPSCRQSASSLGDRDFSIGFRRDANGDFAFVQRITEQVCTVGSPVGQKLFGSSTLLEKSVATGTVL
jgi:hypothetical protein